MTKPKVYHHYVNMPLTQRDRALLSYYAHRYGRDMREIIRSMVRQYIDADKDFDPKAFLDHVEKVLIPSEEGDPTVQTEIREKAHEYVERRTGETLKKTRSGRAKFEESTTGSGKSRQ